jgi:tetratricopeptide (TPR) repeat protein
MYGYSAGQGDFFCLFSIKALSIDSSNSEARWVSGLTKLMFGWNWKAGEREICLTLALDPNNAIAHIVLSIYYFMVGESAQAVNECKRACLLDRLSPFTQPAVYFALYLAGLNKEAKQRMLENKGRLSGFFKYHGCLGFCAIQDQDWNIAIREFQMAAETSGGSSFMKARQAYALAASGRVDATRAIFRELVRQAESRYIPAMEFAVLASGLGETDEALNWLDKAHEARSTHLIYIGLEALFDPLRKSSRFQESVHRMGLPATE